MSSDKRFEIDAILGEEFIELIDSLEVKDEFEKGVYNCIICGDKVDYKNVLIVFPLSQDEVGFVCKKPECVVNYKSSESK